MRKTLLLCLPLVLTGCEQYVWFKEGATQQEVAKAEYRCEQEAAKAYPVYMVPDYQTTTKASQGNASCDDKDKKPSKDCASSSAAQTTTNTVMSDANRQNREDMIDKCMRADGWQYLPLKQP